MQGIPEGAMLVSFDIVNMFPSIDNEKGMKSVKDALNRRSILKPSTDCIIDALSICLNHNNSVFAGQNLIQTNGTAMGAANSCSYSDLAVENIDCSVMESKLVDFTEIFYFGRYRDDCFNVWVGSRDRLQAFLQFLNSIDTNIQFTMEVSDSGLSLNFLDVKLTLVNNQIQTSVYSKPTDSHLYLHGLSNHSKNTKNGISIGVATRLRRLCSTDEEFDKQSVNYKGYLAARGHNPKVINESFNKVRDKPRTVVRQPSNANSKFSDVSAMFVTQFNPLGPDVKGIVSKHAHLLYDSPNCGTKFPRGSICTVYKRLKNLKELMVRADPYKQRSASVQNPGLVSCGRCDSCKNFVDSVDSFKCSATGKVFQITKSLSCNTDNVVYLCYCTNCKKQGVGSTIGWKPRLRNYKSHIKKGIKSCHIAKHFIECCNDEVNPVKFMRFILIDCVDNSENLSDKEIEELLLQKEKFWIGSVCAIHQGLNSYHDWRRKKRVQKHNIPDW